MPNNINDLNEQLDILEETKAQIKSAIIEKGQEISEEDSFRSYATKIANINTVNNQDKTINENGTYRADEGYTGLGEVTVEVNSIPDGIYIQDTVPTDVSYPSSILLLESPLDGVISDIIPSDLPMYDRWGTSNWGTEKVRSDVVRYLAAFNSARYHIVLNSLIGWGDSYENMQLSLNETGRVYARLFTMPSVLSKGDYGWGTTGSSSGGSYALNRLWSDFDIYDCNTGELLHASDLSSSESGLYADIDNTRYIIYMKNNSSYVKQLDTSNANATSSDIISGKTAYVNNTKITGTMPNNGAINITPSTSQQSIPAGYTSGGTVSAVDNTIDSNIQAENIKLGTIILGIEGTFEGTISEEEYEEVNSILDDILGEAISEEDSNDISEGGED